MINVLQLSVLLPLLWPNSSSLDTPLHCFDVEAGPSDYIVQSSGQIYRQSSIGQLLSEPVLLADLSDSGWHFSAHHKAVQSWLPVTVFGAQQHFEQLILLARDPSDQFDQLVIVRIFPQQKTVWQFADLQPHLSDDVVAGTVLPSQPDTVESLWQQVQQAPGWWRPLPGWAVQLPQLYAGMLFIASTSEQQTSSCPDYPLDLSVKVIHMHSGHKTKPEVEITVPHTGPLHWQLRVTPEQQISVWLEQDAQAWQLDAALQQITAECLDCYQTLDLSQWPQQIEVATFWYEEGAY